MGLHFNKTNEAKVEQRSIFEELLNQIEKINDSLTKQGMARVSFDNKEYVSSGEESYEPYNYEHLISAIMLCDDKASYFMI